jgi:hypothetical protein
MENEPAYRFELCTKERWCVVNPKGVVMVTNLSAQDAENIAWLMNMANGERRLRLQREACGS